LAAAQPQIFHFPGGGGIAPASKTLLLDFRAPLAQCPLASMRTMTNFTKFWLYMWLKTFSLRVCKN